MTRLPLPVLALAFSLGALGMTDARLPAASNWHEASATAGSASAEADHLVSVGADDPGSPAPPSKVDRFEYLAYFPDTLQVHRGDVVRFQWRGDHTVTFQPGGVRPDTLFAADEVEGQVRIDGIFPSRNDCDLGRDRSDLPPCVYSSADQYLNTGASTPNDDFQARIEFDVPEGVYAYFCSFHPQMRGEIEVVGAAQQIATAAQVDDAREEQIAADTAAAEALIANFEMPAPEVIDGGLRWQVQIGAATADGRVAVLRYLPSNLTIEPGDEVEFVIPPSPRTEAHSVSFLPLPDAVRANAPAHYLDLRCDQDGLDEGAPGVTGAVALVAMGQQECPVGNIEVLHQPWAYSRPLHSPDGIVAGPDPVHDSGMMLNARETCDDSCDPWTGQATPTTFEATFPQAGTFEYWCFLHDPRGMAANITVAEP